MARARELPLVDHAALARKAVASTATWSRLERRLLVLEHMKMLCVLVCSMFACAAPNSDDPAVDTATDEQPAGGAEPGVIASWNGGSEDPDGEVITVDGSWDDYQLPGGIWGDSHRPPHGGGGNPMPYYEKWTKIPKGEDCTRELTHGDCVECCNRNFFNVWTPWCSRRRKDEDKAKCQTHVGTRTYPACYRGCDGKPGDPHNKPDQCVRGVTL
ncbi:MAG TPA: hypothetical protein VN253_21045 [Kofleriaceae bacterium]|nr:hypothetical protein [Kofleriaceae bacterium]